MKFPAWYGILVGLLMIAQWSFSILAGGVPEFQTEPWEIDFHLGEWIGVITHKRSTPQSGRVEKR